MRRSLFVLGAAALVMLLSAGDLARRLHGPGEGDRGQAGPLGGHQLHSGSSWPAVASCSCRQASPSWRSASRAAKNAGTVVAKILTNFSIAAIGWWACGFAFAFGGPLDSVIGHDGGFFFTNLGAYSVTER